MAKELGFYLRKHKNKAEIVFSCLKEREREREREREWERERGERERKRGGGR